MAVSHDPDQPALLCRNTLLPIAQIMQPSDLPYLLTRCHFWDDLLRVHVAATEMLPKGKY